MIEVMSHMSKQETEATKVGGGSGPDWPLLLLLSKPVQCQGERHTKVSMRAAPTSQALTVTALVIAPPIAAMHAIGCATAPACVPDTRTEAAVQFACSPPAHHTTPSTHTTRATSQASAYVPPECIAGLLPGCVRQDT